DGATHFPDAVSPPGAQSPSIVYPLQDAVVPTSVKAPVVQWEGAGAADHLYRVRVVSGLATVDTILAYDPKSALQPPMDRWQLLASSTDGQVQVTVELWDAATG